MKNNFKYFSLFFCALLLFVSCGRNYSVSFTKRQYRNGYYINFSEQKSMLKAKKELHPQKAVDNIRFQQTEKEKYNNERLAENSSNRPEKKFIQELNKKKENRNQIFSSRKNKNNTTTSNTTIFSRSKFSPENELRKKITSLKNSYETSSLGKVLLKILVILLLISLLVFINNKVGLGPLYLIFLLFILVLSILWLFWDFN